VVRGFAGGAVERVERIADYVWGLWQRGEPDAEGGRYVLALEEDVARLRAENRALVNSLLGTAGFPPVLPEDDARRGLVGLSPVRRRTWTQIAREREMTAGKSSAGEHSRGT
jgi:hypothetical protein